MGNLIVKFIKGYFWLGWSSRVLSEYVITSGRVEQAVRPQFVGEIIGNWFTRVLSEYVITSGD